MHAKKIWRGWGVKSLPCIHPWAIIHLLGFTDQRLKACKTCKLLILFIVWVVIVVLQNMTLNDKN